jgi:hypothetical protein
MEVREWKEAGRIHPVHGEISRKNEKISGRMEENGRKHRRKSFHLHFAENQHLASGKYTMKAVKKRDITGFPAATSMRAST